MILPGVLSTQTPSEAQGQKFEKCWEETLSLTHHMAVTMEKPHTGQRVPGVDDMVCKTGATFKTPYDIQ